MPSQPDFAQRAAAWDRAERVLCIRLDSIGDVLMSTPAMRAVQARGRREVTLLTSPEGASLVGNVPVVDAAITYQAPWTPARRDGGVSAFDRDLLDEIASRSFDAAIVFTVCTQDALPAATLAMLAGIPLRLAFEPVRSYGLLTDPVPEPEADGPIRHEVERQLALVASVGYTTEDSRLSFAPTAEQRRDAGAWLNATGLVPGTFAVIHPGASAPSRRYDPVRFAAVADLLAERGVSSVVVGAREDADAVANVRDHVAEPVRCLVGRSIGELAALFERAGCVIANNSGPGHVAAAVGAPVVSLYARTNMQHAPWAARSRTLGVDTACMPCLSSACYTLGHPCLDVAPSRVADAALAFIEPTPAVRPAVRVVAPRPGDHRSAVPRPVALPPEADRDLAPREAGTVSGLTSA